MITRFYFVTYKTGNDHGKSIEGYFTLSSKSWFPQPENVLTKARKFIEQKNIANEFIITQFYRVL